MSKTPPSKIPPSKIPPSKTPPSKIAPSKTSPSKTPAPKIPWSKAVWPTAAAVAAALVLPGGAAFAAGSSKANAGSTSVGSGNQALLSLNLPADICGLAVAVLGSAEGSCQGGAVVQGASLSGGTSRTSTGAKRAKSVGADSVASGNKVSVPVNAPVNVCGVSIAILGSAQSGCQGGSAVIVKQTGPTGSGKPGGPGSPGWPGGPGGPGGPGWPGNPGGPSGLGGGHHGGHKGHKHHKRHEKHHTTTSTSHHGGTTTVTTQTKTPTSTPASPKTPGSTAVLSSSVLPTTGANLAGMVAVGLACLGLGTGVVVAGRRRRPAADES
jgi:LPXTG-motif cell wall-anchored protein